MIVFVGSDSDLKLFNALSNKALFSAVKPWEISILIVLSFSN